MGYTTDFSGRFSVTPALKPEHAAYLRAFAHTRRMKRVAWKTKYLEDPIREAAGLKDVGTDGGHYVGAHADGNFGQESTEDVIDHNKPPSGQPGLWCQWVPTADGHHIEWDGGEKFYDYVAWMEYLVQHFLKPWGYKIDGQVEWRGEEDGDIGKIIAKNNKITTKRGRITYH